MSTPTAPPKLLSCAAAARLLPNKPSPSAIWRKMREGQRARNGEVIRLSHVRHGRQLFTTENDLSDFSRRLAEADVEFFAKRDGDRSPATSKKRERSAKRKAKAKADSEKVLRKGKVLKPKKPKS